VRLHFNAVLVKFATHTGSIKQLEERET